MFLFPFLGIVCFFLNVGALNQPGDVLKKIQDRGELVVAMVNEDNPPFAIRDAQGNDLGLDIELSKSIAKYLKVKLKILRTAKIYDELVDQVAEGKADLGIGNLSLTLDRAKKVNYSHSYVDLRKSVLLNHKTFAAWKKNDLESVFTFFKGKNKLGVVRGSSYVEFAKNLFPEATLVFFDGDDSLVQAVEDGRVAGGFGDEFFVKKTILFNPKGSLRYQAVILKGQIDKSGILVHKSQQDFLNWINTFLELKFKTLGISEVIKLYKHHLSQKGFIK